MKAKLYIQNEDFIAGMTLKDEASPESNNMALHACVNTNHIVSNRQQLAHFLSCATGDFVCADQTHSENFHKVTIADKGRGVLRLEDAIPNTDALYTFEPNTVLCCFTADCVPVIFYNETNGLIGVIHSGWQGTVKEITSNLFKHLIKVENCRPQDFHVQLGAALSQKRFEVDEDVYLQFKALGYADDFIYFNEATRKYHINNQQTVRKQCEIAGIPATQITIDRMCTYDSPDGFSYRQNRKCGRHLSFITRRSSMRE